MDLGAVEVGESSRKVQPAKASPTKAVFRRWSRTLHRSVGYFFLGTTLLYALSGVAFNHMRDVDARYRDRHFEFRTHLDLTDSGDTTAKVRRLLDEVHSSESYQHHVYFDHSRRIRIDLVGGGVGRVDVTTGEGDLSFREPVPVVYQTTLLHSNPHKWWTWFSDVYAAGLFLLCATAVIMMRGKNGPLGLGGVFIVAGIVAPIVLYQLR